MNEAPSNQTGLNDTFSSQQATQGNPFTADLKGEFTSNFGTNTNAVSQIFKEGGFVNQNRAKYYAIGGLAFVLLAGLFYFLTLGDDSESEETASTAGETDSERADETEEGDGTEKTEDTAADEAKEAEKAEVAKEEVAPASAPVAESKPKLAGSGGGVAGSGPLSLDQPADGATVGYDESQGAAQFSWTGGSGHIVFSRHPTLNPPSMRVFVKGNTYAFQQPWPGKWYWRVENRSGKTDIRSFNVNPPQRRAISLDQPASGGTIAGSGGVVSWKGDAKVGFYRVEFSTGGWANPQHRFASSGNSLQLNGVAPGQYQLRLGAFSEVAGRWEYTSPISVTVQ